MPANPAPITLRGFTLVPGYIYVDVVDGPVVMFAANARAEYVVDRLIALGVRKGQVRNTIHVIPKGIIASAAPAQQSQTSAIAIRKGQAPQLPEAPS